MIQIIVVEVWFGLMFLQDVLTILTCAAKKLCVVNNDRNQDYIVPISKSSYLF